MFLFQYHEDRLHLLADEQRRDEPRQRQLHELDERRRGSRVQIPAPRGMPYTGPERRLIPCPEMREAVTP